MPDNPRKRGTADRRRISLTQEHEVAYWTRRLGVNRRMLKEAVQAVGHEVKAVQAYIKERLPGWREPAAE